MIIKGTRIYQDIGKSISNDVLKIYIGTEALCPRSYIMNHMIHPGIGLSSNVFFISYNKCKMENFKPSKRLKLQLFKKELSLIDRIENEVGDDFKFNVRNSDGLSNLLRFKLRNELYNFVKWTRWEYDRDSISQEQGESRLEQLNECRYWFDLLENALKGVDKMCDEIAKDVKELLEQHKEIIFPQDRKEFDDALEDVYKKYEDYDTKVLNTDEIENKD